MTNDTRVRVTVVPSEQVDRRLPPGWVLVEALPNGEVHLAYRENEWDSWPAGVWAQPV